MEWLLDLLKIPPSAKRVDELLREALSIREAQGSQAALDFVMKSRVRHIDVFSQKAHHKKALALIRQLAV